MNRKFLPGALLAATVALSIGGCGSSSTNESVASACGTAKYFMEAEPFLETDGGTGSLTGNAGTNIFAITRKGNGDWLAHIASPTTNHKAYILVVKAGHDNAHLVSYGVFTPRDKKREATIPAVQTGKLPGETTGAKNQVFFVCGGDTPAASPSPSTRSAKPTQK